MSLIFAEENGLQVDQSGQNRPSVFTGTSRSNPCTLQSGYWLVGIVDWPNRAGLPGVARESCVLSTSKGPAPRQGVSLIGPTAPCLPNLRVCVPLPSRLMLKPMRPSFPQHRRDLVEVRMRAYIFIALSPRQPSLEAPLAKRDRDLSRDRQALSSGPRSELDFQ